MELNTRNVLLLFLGQGRNNEDRQIFMFIDLRNSMSTYMKLLRTCLASSVARELAKPTTAKYSYD